MSTVTVGIGVLKETSKRSGRSRWSGKVPLRKWLESYSFPGVALTKYHKLGNLNDSTVLSYSDGSQQAKIQVSQGWFLVRLREGFAPCLLASDAWPGTFGILWLASDL